MTDPRVAPMTLPAGWDDTRSRDVPVGLDPRGLRVVVAGLGVSGWAAADVLAQRDARVVAVDAGESESISQHAQLLGALGGQALTGKVAPKGLPDVDGGAPDVVVASPGWPPHAPLLREATDRGIPVWSEVELGWRLRREGAPPWLAVTGTNGKTTTVRMLTAMLTAAGQRAMAVGNVGTPLLDGVVAPDQPDVLVVELSSFQLHFTQSMAPRVATCLNLAPDHLDWHGGLAGYTRDKATVYANAEVAAVYNAQDDATEQMVRDADVVEGCRAVGFTTEVPAPGMLGVVDDTLCDRAFGHGVADNAIPLASVDDVASACGGVAAPHHIANTLAAAALAIGHGASRQCVAEGLRLFAPDPHRAALVATHSGVRWVDDSKATNSHAADASLRCADSIVWIAGGLAKGASFDDLVTEHKHRLRACVLIGVDREPMRTALRRHAPDVPVVEVDAPDTGSMTAHERSAAGADVMRSAVRLAAERAGDGDTVLLAPACASMDQFTNYHVRGDEFAAAVSRYIAGGDGS